MNKVLLLVVAGLLLSGCKDRVIWNDNGKIDEATQNREVWNSQGKMDTGGRKIWTDQNGNDVIK